MKEVFKSIPNFSIRYQISNLGRVKRLERVIERPTDKHCPKLVCKEIILKPKITKFGYQYLKLVKDDGTRKDIFVHRLVASAFVENPDNKPCVNHKDGNKQNNNASNLEWSTIKENNQHAYDTGLKRRVHAGQFLKGVTGKDQYIYRRK